MSEASDASGEGADAPAAGEVVATLSTSGTDAP
jgi:hypothetical protein